MVGLIALAAKDGIPTVGFTEERREEGLAVREAAVLGTRE